MGFPDNILTTDERVVLHLHPHWKTLFGPFFAVCVLAVATVVAAVFLPATFVPIAIAVGLLLMIVVVVGPWLRLFTTHYVFTTERVLVREGVLQREGRDIPLGRINDVSFSHGLLDRIVGCGTLTIESAGERGQVVLYDIPQVERAQSVLYELVEADRERHTFGDDDRDAITREQRHGRR